MTEFEKFCALLEDCGIPFEVDFGHDASRMAAATDPTSDWFDREMVEFVTVSISQAHLRFKRETGLFVEVESDELGTIEKRGG